MEAFLKVSSTTVKPPNKRHVAGDKLYINSHALSLVERLFSFQRFHCYYVWENGFFGSHELSTVEFIIDFSEGPLSEVSLYI